jgi:arylsulfatase A-like enzyme
MAQYPVCIASRCSMVTGWPPHVRGHRTVYHLLHPDEPNMFKYLKNNGYDVYWYGKNDCLVHDRFGESVTEWGFFADGPEWSGKDNPWAKDDPRYFSFLFNAGRDRRAYPDYRRIQAGIRMLKTRTSSKPFCLFLPLFFPHPPFTAPPEFYGMYRADDVPTLRPEGKGKPDFYRILRTSMHLDKLDEGVLRKINAVYLGMISYSDWMLGEVLDAVKETGHDDDTAIFFLSDHGEWAGDYGVVEKWSAAMDDAILHVPLVARVPGGVKGHVAADMVELYDVMATVLKLAGIEPRHTHFARSLEPQIAGKPGDPERAAFAEGGYNINEPHAFEPVENFPKDHIYYPKVSLEVKNPETITRTTMIRTHTHKLSLRPDGRSELYDLKKDPRELVNVYDDAKYAKTRQELETRMLEWYVRTSDVVPVGRDDRSLPPYNG